MTGVQTCALPICHHVRTERRPARLAAAPAVAEKARAKFAAYFVSDGAAETGAFMHVCFQRDGFKEIPQYQNTSLCAVLAVPIMLFENRWCVRLPAMQATKPLVEAVLQRVVHRKRRL